jgi:hypothetical protein
MPGIYLWHLFRDGLSETLINVEHFYSLDIEDPARSIENYF